MPGLSELANKDPDELKEHTNQTNTSGNTETVGDTETVGETRTSGSEPDSEGSPGIHTPTTDEAKKARRRAPMGAGAAHAELVQLRERLEQVLNLNPERGDSAISAIEGLQNDIEAAADIIAKMQSPKALQEIEGVGPKTAEKIAKWARGL